jgi:hypothetical protein
MEADPRAQMKQFTKAGVSTGKAQRSAASLGSATAMADARNQAAQTQLQADVTNANQRLDFQYGSEMEAQKLAMIQQALGQSDWSVQMAQQMAANSRVGFRSSTPTSEVNPCPTKLSTSAISPVPL